MISVSRFNPLERFFSSNDVEMVSEQQQPMMSSSEFYPDSASVHGFDYDGPRLPEEGLRSRIADNFGRQLSRAEICSQSSDKM